MIAELLINLTADIKRKFTILLPREQIFRVTSSYSAWPSENYLVSQIIIDVVVVDVVVIVALAFLFCCLLFDF